MSAGWVTVECPECGHEWEEIVCESMFPRGQEFFDMDVCCPVCEAAFSQEIRRDEESSQ